MNLDDFKQVVERHGPVVRDGGDWRPLSASKQQHFGASARSLRTSAGERARRLPVAPPRLAGVPGEGLSWMRTDQTSEQGNSGTEIRSETPCTSVGGWSLSRRRLRRLAECDPRFRCTCCSCSTRKGTFASDGGRAPEIHTTRLSTTANWSSPTTRPVSDTVSTRGSLPAPWTFSWSWGSWMSRTLEAAHRRTCLCTQSAIGGDCTARRLSCRRRGPNAAVGSGSKRAIALVGRAVERKSQLSKVTVAQLSQVTVDERSHPRFRRKNADGRARTTVIRDSILKSSTLPPDSFPPPLSALLEGLGVCCGNFRPKRNVHFANPTAVRHGPTADVGQGRRVACDYVQRSSN